MGIKPPPDQYHCQEPIADLQDWNRWRAFAQPVIDRLAGWLEQQQITAIAAPEMPPLVDGLEGFVRQPYRVLAMWIPDWAPHVDAGQFVVRVDTLGRKA